MAYANLIKAECADKTEFFCRMRDFICKRNGTYDYSATGIGWTLHDSSYAVDENTPEIDDWYVIKSVGESGDEDLYFRVLWVSGYIRVHGFQSWDAATHAGANQYCTSTTAFIVGEAVTPALWVYGDLDAVFCVIWLTAGTDVRAVNFGKASKPWDYLDDEVATCSTTLTAGSDVSIVVDAVPTGWAVDREIYIRTSHNNDTATVEIEKITIKTLSGTTITADLSNSYTADNKLSDHVGYYCQSSNVIGTSNVLISANGTVSTGATTIAYNTGIASPNNDPSAYENRWGMAECGLNASAAGYLGVIKNIYRIVVGALALEDILQELDETEWRYFKVYSNTHYVFKEV